MLNTSRSNDQTTSNGVLNPSLSNASATQPSRPIFHRTTATNRIPHTATRRSILKDRKPGRRLTFGTHREQFEHLTGLTCPLPFLLRPPPLLFLVILLYLRDVSAGGSVPRRLWVFRSRFLLGQLGVVSGSEEREHSVVVSSSWVWGLTGER